MRGVGDVLEGGKMIAIIVCGVPIVLLWLWFFKQVGLFEDWWWEDESDTLDSNVYSRVDGWFYMVCGLCGSLGICDTCRSNDRISCGDRNNAVQQGVKQ